MFDQTENLTPPPELRTVRTDADIAAELREELTPHLQAACKVLDKARAAGMKIEFMINPDSFGIHRVPPITITKAL